MEESRKFSSRLMEIFAATEDEGLVPRILITSPRHQQGKTATMMRLMEKTEEELHGRKFSIDNFCLQPLEFVERRKTVPEWTSLGLDEPQRPVSNKNWYTQESQAFVEDLVCYAYEHKPALMALPHSHYLNGDVFGVATSLIVKQDLSHARLYSVYRKMIDRRIKTKTKKIGDFEVDRPYAWDWEAFLRKREEFNIRRGKVLEDKIRAVEILASVSDLSKEQVFQLALADPDKYRDPKTHDVSASQIEAELGVSYAKANYAAVKVRRHERELRVAEKEN